MIDQLTINRIKEASNIVEVVSEFVTLRKSGANYKGLCPFHDEKTPSFMVSPARGTCHCFGCGKGGNPVSFIMEHEQLTYPEALRWLAKKYNIEIQEREISDQEREHQNERESMFIVNDWAANYFSDLLHNDPDGVAIGMQYYRSRGFRDDVIKDFRLGYDIGNRHALIKQAHKDGHKDTFIEKTGICYRNDRGEMIDRYSDRVIFPWIGLSGKVVGFSARVLDSRTKGVNQKYVNSPDSDVFHKERELFGIWQAKRAIAKEDRVFIVEGQTDVISMYQCGIQNVVANSGTALSIHQIHMLHRFTNNITMLYDGDAAGIHAALRGTDMLLSEGINVKVLFLPDGDDPDSFARKHTAADFRQYVEDNQTDFVQFKVDLLLKQAKDPQQRSEAIDSIVQSISVIPNQILRDTYIHDTATRVNMAEKTLIARMNSIIKERKDGNRSTATAEAQQTTTLQAQVINTPPLQRLEQMIVQQVVKNGHVIILEEVEDEEGNVLNLNVAQYIYYNLSSDDLLFTSEPSQTIMEEALTNSSNPEWKSDVYFLNHENIEISKFANEMLIDKYALTQTEKKTYLNTIEEEMEKRKAAEKIKQQVMHLLFDYRMELVEQRYRQLQQDIIAKSSNPEETQALMQQLAEVQKMRAELARMIGKNLI